MSIRITYFVHGTTTDNERGLATGWQNGELSFVGKKQAEELADLTKHLHFDAVFSSDLRRAVVSAELAFGKRYNIIPDSRLRECNYGDLTGRPTSEFENKLNEYISVPFPRGESYKDVEARVTDFLTVLKRDYDGRLIAIVSHQAPQLALEVLLKKRTWDEAITEDWRRTKAWKPGWDYTLD